MPISTGTIIFTARRKGFAVLVADRMVSTSSIPPKLWHGRKTALHLTLPIAMATSGLAVLPFGGDGRLLTVELLDKVMRKVRGNGPIDLEDIAGRVEDRLAKLVRDAREFPMSDEEKQLAYVRVYVATAFFGESRLGWLTLGDRALWKEAKSDAAPPSMPECLVDFYAQQETVVEDGLDDPLLLADCLRLKTEKGIEYEKSLHGGDNWHCGGPVDVVLVDKNGARKVMR